MTIRDQAFQGKPLTPFIIDAHTHMGAYYKLGWHQKPDFTSVESVIRVYDEMGVNCCVTAPHLIIDSMTVEANEFAAECAKAFPGRIYGYISVAPFEGMDVLKENLKRFTKDPSFVGMKYLGGYNGDYVEEAYQYAADCANEIGCPILCHTYGGTPKLSVLRDLAEKRPNLNIIAAHQGGGYRQFTLEAAKIVNEVPNFHLEICGSLRNELGIEDIVDLVGPDRVIHGTDVINLDARFDFGRVAFSPLSDEVKEKIFAGNFLRLLEKSQMGKIAH